MISIESSEMTEVNLSVPNSKGLLTRIADSANKLGPFQWQLWRQQPSARRFHAFCIGTPKSGTHSIAEIFSKRHRAEHEPACESLIRTIIDASTGLVTQAQLVEFVRSRDRELRLEMESSHLLFHFLDILLQEFREARFILTIRDCYSWVDSQINNQLSYIEPDHWKDFGEFKYQSATSRHPKEERILEEFGVYTLDGYLSAWAFHNSRVLATVPKHQLLVVRTEEISRDLLKIAHFVGVPTKHLNSQASHSFKGGKKYGLLSKLDEQYVEDKVNSHCRSLMDAYFPQIENFKAWKKSCLKQPQPVA
jgi:hypothetical protein